jgi:hypothetical protein
MICQVVSAGAQASLPARLRRAGCPRTVRRPSRKLTMFTMTSTEELNKKLRTLDAEFDREMRARGFDPAQADNVALPSHLAALYAERDQIKAELEELKRRENQ